MSFTHLSLPDQLSLLFLLALVCIGWWQLLFWLLEKLNLLQGTEQSKHTKTNNDSSQET